MDGIITQALSTTTVVKILVDTVKLAAPNVPDWIPASLALASGPVVVALLMVAEGQAMTGQLIAQAVLAGIMAGGGAIGVTELSRRASKSIYVKVGSNGH